MTKRLVILVNGIVQGVGFRPFVHNLAARLGLGGFVRNETGGVRIEVEGEPGSLDGFLRELTERPPPLAVIERVSCQPVPPRGDDRFSIEHSEEAAGPVFVSPDVATCADCLAEMLNPADRRHGYAFLNCTNCGPRLTIVTGAPYDRERTTMAGFAMCPACRAEYDNPADRRFHAQPTACAACGPRTRLLDAAGTAVEASDPLAAFAEAMRSGRIGAVKGLGGYHLACDARNAEAVAELRRRKQRDEKPFALMARDLAAAEALCEVNSIERGLLASPAAPIVLLRKRESAGVAEAVAPGNPCLGVMLPGTPLHHLLMRLVDGPLVMTSGNRSDEPIAYLDDDATQRLSGIADLYLTHDRPIRVRCDDSVVRVVDGQPLPIRRSRGYAPRPVPLPFECPAPILAVGGQLKATFALGVGRQAFLSHHLGDLDHHAAYEAFVRDVGLYEELFAVTPRVIVHDAHPDYATTRYAEGRSVQQGQSLLSVQHHFAHLASCMVENGLDETVIGVTFDGTGYGSDGAVWGGEFLIGDYSGFRRAAHFRYVAMPGGDQAIREPWRMALAHLIDAGVTDAPVKARLLPLQVRTIARMIERRLNAPPTSSAGRLFDAVASLAGVRDRVSYEGQAAAELEWLASGRGSGGSYPYRVEPDSTGALRIDVRPLVAAAADDVRHGVDNATIARRFHDALADVVVDVCGRLREATGIGAVVLSGGVFLNALLTSQTCARLTRDGFRVYRHRLVPPGDGGLSLGQLAVAARQLSRKER
jgi:hydrogenase maturation protein HypF